MATPREESLCGLLFPDLELIFDNYSMGRRGGALNLQPRIGQAVAGVLFEVFASGWEVLDRKEGAPNIIAGFMSLPSPTMAMRSRLLPTRLSPKGEAVSLFTPHEDYVHIARDTPPG